MRMLCAFDAPHSGNALDSCNVHFDMHTISYVETLSTKTTEDIADT